MIEGLLLRPMVDDDVRFVFNSWIESYERDGGRWWSLDLKGGDEWGDQWRTLDPDLLVYARMLDRRPPRDWRGKPLYFFRTMHRALVTRLLEASSTTVAANPERPDQIAGWLCARGATLLYVYVRDSFRRQGIARALVAAQEWPDGAEVHYTARTKLGEAAKPSGWEFRPLEVFED